MKVARKRTLARSDSNRNNPPVATVLLTWQLFQLYCVCGRTIFNLF
jgi:hypothetical protein